MKRLLLSLLFATGCFAAGSVQQTFTQLGTSDSWVLTFRWQGDSIDGSVPVTPAKGLNTIQGYVATAVQVVPGTPSPTALYSVMLPDGSGIDILGGAATSLSPTIAASFTPSGATVPLQGAVSLTVTGQGVPSAKGAVTIYFVKPSAFTIAQPTGATNVNWITQVSNKPFFDVRSFKAVGDGTTDDHAAFQAAINTACSINGGTIYIPGGDYDMGVSNLTIPCSNITMAGSRGKTRLIFFDVGSGDLITSTIGNFEVALRDFTILGSSSKASGYAVHEINNSHFEISNVLEQGAPFGIKIDGCVICRVNESQVFDAREGDGIGMLITGAEVSDLILDHFLTSGRPDHAYFAGVKVESAGYVSLRTCELLVALRDLFVAPGNGQVVASLESIQTNFDTAAEFGILMAPTGTGAIVRTRIVQSWTASAAKTGVVLDTTGGGRIDDILFLGHSAKLNQQFGFLFSGTGITNWSIQASTITNNSQSSVNGFSGISIPANLGNGSIQNSRIGNDAIDTPTQAYGIFGFNGTGSNLLITGNDLRGNLTGPMVFGAMGTGNNVSNNPPYNPVGNTSYDCSAHGGSPCTVPIGPTQATVFVQGGTVSSIVAGGVTFATSTNQQITVPANSSFVVTYSGLPTITLNVF